MSGRSLRLGQERELCQAAGPGHHGQCHPAPLFLQHGHQRRVTHARCRQAVHSYNHISTPTGKTQDTHTPAIITILILFMQPLML